MRAVLWSCVLLALGCHNDGKRSRVHVDQLPRVVVRRIPVGRDLELVADAANEMPSPVTVVVSNRSASSFSVQVGEKTTTATGNASPQVMPLSGPVPRHVTLGPDLYRKEQFEETFGALSVRVEVYRLRGDRFMMVFLRGYISDFSPSGAYVDLCGFEAIQAARSTDAQTRRSGLESLERLKSGPCSVPDRISQPLLRKAGLRR